MNPLPSVLLHQRSPSEGLLGAVSLTSTEAPPPPPPEILMSIVSPLTAKVLPAPIKLRVFAAPTRVPAD